MKLILIFKICFNSEEFPLLQNAMHVNLSLLEGLLLGDCRF